MCFQEIYRVPEKEGENGSVSVAPKKREAVKGGGNKWEREKKVGESLGEREKERNRQGKSGDTLQQNVEYECFLLLTTYLGCTAVTTPLTPPPTLCSARTAAPHDVTLSQRKGKAQGKGTENGWSRFTPPVWQSIGKFVLRIMLFILPSNKLRKRWLMLLAVT